MGPIYSWFYQKNWIGTKKSGPIHLGRSPRAVLTYLYSANTMLTRLNWEPLASRRHAARLLMFYKIHYGLVATPVPLDIKLHPVPTRVENSLLWLTTSHRHHVIITFILVSPALFVTGTFFLKRSLGPLRLRYLGVWFTDNPICILVLHRQPV